MQRKRKGREAQTPIAVTAADVRKQVEERPRTAGKTSKLSTPIRGKPRLFRVAPRGLKCSHCGMRLDQRDFAAHVERCSKRAMKKFRKRLAKCPLCEKHFLKDLLARHMTSTHGQTYGTPANLPIRFKPLPQPPARVRDQPEVLIACEKCQVMVYPDAMQRHINSFHSPEAELRAILSSAHRLPFVLLPAGRLRDAVEQFRNLSHTHHQSLIDAAFDWERLEKVESFRPTARYVGLKLWKGYVAFQFQASNPVVLECPRTGNATYVIKGDWKKLVPATKRELRSEHREQTRRIIHNASWETCLWRAVFGSSRGEEP